MPKSQFSDAYKCLLEVIVAERREAGFTQVDLSARLGKPQPWVSKVEQGVRRIDVVEFYALMRAMGRDPEVVFGRLVSMLPSDVEI